MNDWHIIWRRLPQLIAALSIISVIQRSYDMGLINTFIIFVNYYRYVVRYIYTIINFIVPIQIPLWYQDLSILSWFFSMTYARVYLSHMGAALHGVLSGMILGSVPVTMADDGELIEEKSGSLIPTYIRTYILTNIYCIISGVTLLGFLLPALQVWRFLRVLGVHWRHTRYVARRYFLDKSEEELRELRESGDAEYEDAMIVGRLGIELINYNVYILWSYIKYIIQVIIVVAIVFAINAGLFAA